MIPPAASWLGAVQALDSALKAGATIGSCFVATSFGIWSRSFQLLRDSPKTWDRKVSWQWISNRYKLLISVPQEAAMDDPVSELAQRGLALTRDERSRLIDLLLESLHEPPVAEVEEAWSAEIERRLAEYDRGEVQSISAEDVFAKARSIARQTTLAE